MLITRTKPYNLQHSLPTYLHKGIFDIQHAGATGTPKRDILTTEIDRRRGS